MKNILVVDDSAIVRDELTNDLIEAGYHCFEAGNGEEALDIVNAEHVDLIISDYNMPKMDGLDMCKNLKKSIPVVMMTSNNSTVLKKEGKQLGVIAWIVKPYDKTVISRCLNTMQERNIF